jgi:hypothetical protein
MNARIQQLMDRSFTDEQGERFDPERFAELIVEECARDFDKTYMVGGETMGNYIRQKFGVEP